MVLLGDMAKEVSSKNAGNFTVTFDVEFHDESSYQHVLDSGVFEKNHLADFLQIALDEIVSVSPFLAGLAVKIAVRRHHSSGDVGETDVFGVQQYVPLLDLEIPNYVAK